MAPEEGKLKIHHLYHMRDLLQLGAGSEFWVIHDIMTRDDPQGAKVCLSRSIS